MGTWGTTIFADDFAADIRDDFRTLLGDGLSTAQAVERLLAEHRETLNDEDEANVFWLALAASQWKLGRLEDRTRNEAIKIIDDGSDLARWDEPRNRQKRVKVLAALKSQLLSPQPAEKKVSRRARAESDWVVGEMVAFRVSSGKWVVLRTIGHHEDKGGRFAICELLDSATTQILSREEMAKLPIRRESTERGISQFCFGLPKKKADQSRVVRLNFVTDPAQKPGSYTFFVWPYVDRLCKEIFDLE